MTSQNCARFIKTHIQSLTHTNKGTCVWVSEDPVVRKHPLRTYERDRFVKTSTDCDPRRISPYNPLWAHGRTAKVVNWTIFTYKCSCGGFIGVSHPCAPFVPVGAEVVISSLSRGNWVFNALCEVSGRVNKIG